MSELEMQQEIAELLRKRGFDVYLEVPFLSRSIDIVAVKNGKILAVELKLSDWRKAIAQSADHLHGADQSFICLPRKTRINDEMIDMVLANGIGLMFYDREENEVEEVLPASDSELVWPPARQWLVTAVGAAA